MEPDLDAYVRSAVSQGKLKAYSKVQAGDIYIICVPTPFYFDSDIPKPNVDYVSEAAENISPHVKAGDIVILESTSPVGTTRMIRDMLQKNGVDTTAIYIAYCPERVLPGNIMTELVDNARLLEGSIVNLQRLFQLFIKLLLTNGEILETETKQRKCVN